MKTTTTPADTTLGVVSGIAAYGLWGVIPLYFKLLTAVPPLEMLSHRAGWSFVVLAAFVVVTGRLGQVVAVVRDRRALSTLAASTVLIATNWLTFIYAVNSARVVEASLGYFVAPLANVLLGVAVLSERMRSLQAWAIGLATCGVLVMTWLGGEVPWLAMLLAGSFSLYGLLRKVVAAEALVGLLVETMLLAPLTLGYLVWLGFTGQGELGNGPTSTNLLLVASGPITTVPLVCFAAAARRLRMTTLGFLQFLAPTIQVAVAVVVFGEPFGEGRVVAFGFIWAAIAVYLIDATRRAYESRRVDLPQPELSTGGAEL